MRPLRSGPAACLGLCLLVTWSRPALAASDDGLQQIGTLMWVLTVTEYALLVGVVAIAGASALLGDDGGGGGDELGASLFGSALIMGIGAGFGSMQNGWDPRIAGAMHGALWTGAGLGAWGVLAGQGLDETSPWPTVAAALGLGALGIAGGAVLGGLLVDSENEVWLVYAAPAAAGAAALATWIALCAIPELADQTPLDDADLPVALIAAATAPLLVAALGVGAISVLQAVE